MQIVKLTATLFALMLFSACGSSAPQPPSNGGGGNNGPERCGGIAGLTCGPGKYCHYDISQSCGAADQTGICQTPPGNCGHFRQDVCGCNGVTYASECAANAAGVSASSVGACGS